MKQWLILVSLLFSAITVLAEDFIVEEVASGFNYPWSIAFLPNGDYLVTEKAGGLIRLSANGKEKTIIKNLPETLVKGQGGLAEVMLDTDFATNQTVFITYAFGSGTSNHLKLISARLVNDELIDINELLITHPEKTTAFHYGARMAFLPDNTLLVSYGDGGSYRNEAQKLDNHFGKILRINKDGSIPKDNPFINNKEARPEIYSYGHRNPQGLLVAPDGTIWSHEHGPKGGDELNIVKPGVNYGWPAITYGIDYNGSIISPFKEAEGMEQPIIYWVPSIAPAGMMRYDGKAFPQWQGDLFVSALAERTLRRLDMKENTVVAQEVLLKDRKDRLRDVRTGPDGFIYVLTDSYEGKVLRLKPKP